MLYYILYIYIYVLYNRYIYILHTYNLYNIVGFTWVYKDLYCLKRFCVTPCTPLQTWSPDDLPTNKRLEFEHLSR